MHGKVLVNTFVPVSSVDTDVWRAYVNSEIITDAVKVS